MLTSSKDITTDISHPYDIWLSCHDVKVRVAYNSLSSDFAKYLEDYLMDECHLADNASVWYEDLPHNIYVGQWPVFHGPVI